jgi:hypothetical protein
LALWNVHADARLHWRISDGEDAETASITVVGSMSLGLNFMACKDALVLDVIARQTERVFDAQRPHLEALDSLPALKAWRNAIIRLNKAAQGRGCPLGSLASELANNSEPARKRLADSLFHVARPHPKWARQDAGARRT